uniref:Transmembrane protein n=1 Tax=Romanomermis culicivorax TaxID=13658 RepID=A0A915K8H5_ROMCU
MLEFSSASHLSQLSSDETNVQHRRILPFLQRQTFKMSAVLILLLICILTMTGDLKKAAAPVDSIMMDWMVDDVKTNTTIIHQGGQAQIIFKCSKQIKSCTRPPNQTKVRISQDHAVNDRT